MKKLLILPFLFLGLALFAVSDSYAQIAYSSAFTTSITYQNVGTGTATIVINFYDEASGTAISHSAGTLAEGAGSSTFVGKVGSISSGFSGSAVLSSDQPVVATLVQIPSDSQVINRPLTNGFSSGSSTVLLASVLKNNFNTTSRFSVQNAHSTAIDVTVNLYAVGSTTPIVVTQNNLPVGSAKYFDMGTLSEVSASNFNGSAIVTAVETGTSNPANIVASVLELQTNGSKVSAFEGFASGSTTVYMPSAACQYFNLSTFYAVQNTSDTETATVTVTYDNNATQTADIAPGGKSSFKTCDAHSNAEYNGSATITSVPQDGTGTAPIIVVGKVNGGQVSTAFEGATTGSNKLACPYVRWTSTWPGSRQRAFIAVQNVGSAQSAGAITVSYLNKNGDPVGIHTLGAMATGAKESTNAGNPNVALQGGFSQTDLNEFGTPDGNPGGGFGGAMIIESSDTNAELVGVVRIQSRNGSTTYGEDYNCTAIN